MDREAAIGLHRVPAESMNRSILILAAVLCTLTVSGQQPTIQTNVPLVLVPVTVAERKGALIDGLTVDDFVLSDDGVRQKIHLDTSDTVLAPVSVVLAIQCSDISSTALAKINRVGGMIQPLIAGERGSAAVVAFDDEVRLLQNFTTDSTKIRSAVQKVRGRSATVGRMLDAVAEAARMLAEQPQNRRRILVVIGEARDRGSKTKLDEAIEQIERAGVVVYPATYSAYLSPWTAKPQDNPPTGGGLLTGLGDLIRLGKTNTSDALARASGGTHLSFETLHGLESALTKTGEEIHGQYLLSFVPAASDNSGFHRLEVVVPSRAGVVVRARAGYWPSPSRER